MAPDSNRIPVTRTPTSSNTKDYFTGYTRFHGNSIVFWINSGWIQSERFLLFYSLEPRPSSLRSECSTFVKRGLFTKVEHSDRSDEGLGSRLAILSPCDKRCHVLICMQRRLFAATSYEVQYGRPFLANRSCKSSLRTVLYTILYYNQSDHVTVN